MGEKRFKIREDLIITAQSDRGKTDYMVLNPLSGDTARFSQKTYTILRHFNGRTPEELQRHLRERHNLILSIKSIEGYIDLFLDLYLFDRECLDLYWQRLPEDKKRFVITRLEQWAQEQTVSGSETLPFVAGLIINEVFRTLKEQNIIKTISYLQDLKQISPKNPLGESFLRGIEEAIITAAKLKTHKFSLKNAVALTSILLVILFLGQSFVFKISSADSREKSLRIIKSASEILIQEKSLALIRKK